MTTDRLAGGLRAPGPEGARSSALSVGTILSLCDRLLDEVGRRRHIFAWLRAPGSETEEWLAVDAYYPGNRLVVVCRPEPGPHDHLYGELVPRHGLRLAQFAPADLGPEPASAELALARMIDALGPPRPRAMGQVAEQRARAAVKPGAGAAAGPRTPAAAGPSSHVGPRAAAVQRAVRFVTSHESDALRRQRARHALAGGALRRGPGTAAALALAAALAAEAYLGVVLLALAGGHGLLAVGIALDACSRALGTVAAERTGSRGWAWACLLGGSPVVAVFALFGHSGPVAVAPAPLASLISLLAGVVLVIAVAALILGV